MTVRPTNKFNESSIESCLGWSKHYGLEWAVMRAQSCERALLSDKSGAMFRAKAIGRMKVPDLMLSRYEREQECAGLYL